MKLENNEWYSFVNIDLFFGDCLVVGLFVFEVALHGRLRDIIKVLLLLLGLLGEHLVADLGLALGLLERLELLLGDLEALEDALTLVLARVRLDLDEAIQDGVVYGLMGLNDRVAVALAHRLHLAHGRTRRLLRRATTLSTH